MARSLGIPELIRQQRELEEWLADQMPAPPSRKKPATRDDKAHPPPRTNVAEWGDFDPTLNHWAV
jgi:hypothetical protein